MRSLHTAVLVVMLGILALSYLVFRSISDQIERAYFDPVFDKTDQLEIESRDRHSIRAVPRLFPPTCEGWIPCSAEGIICWMSAGWILLQERTMLRSCQNHRLPVPANNSRTGS